jgi:hypothetical protein
MATVVIGVDPAKRSNTIEVIDSDENVLLMARFENSSDRHRPRSQERPDRRARRRGGGSAHGGSARGHRR